MQELGYRNFNLCKMEDKLLGNTDVYYSLMRYTDGTGDYTPLIEFFADCIHDAYAEAVVEYGGGGKDVLKGLDESSRSLAIEARRYMGWFSIQDACGWTEGIGE